MERIRRLGLASALPLSAIQTKTDLGVKRHSGACFHLSLYFRRILNLYISDFAVGAPYDGPEGRGAVYIYNGKRGGVRETYSQVYIHGLTVLVD